jgi:uncharacterized membrane protein YdjX (TVP38/TMEM64 family)
MDEEQRDQGAAVDPNRHLPFWKRVTIPPQLRLLGFFAVIVAVILLTTTVLRKPIEEGAVWMRQAGVGGFFVLAIAGFVFIMVGGSSTVFDVACGFIYGVPNGECGLS